MINHAKRKHQDTYQEYLKQEKIAKTTDKAVQHKPLQNFGFKPVQVATCRVLELAVSQVVEGARPFSMFDEPSTREIFNLALLGAKEKGPITSGKVRESLIKYAAESRERLKKELNL